MRRILTALVLSVSVLNLSGCVLAFDGGENGSAWNESRDSDSNLSRAVRTQLDSDPVTQSAEFTVSSKHRRIYLDGITDKPEVLAKAIEIALDTPDVKSVRCHVTVIK